MKTADWIRQLIDEDRLWKFYKSPEWMKLKQQVLQDFHYECQLCKQQGRVTRYEDIHGRCTLISTVHHINEVRKHPELALSRYYYDQDGNKHNNLIPVCKSCHNLIHERKFNGSKPTGYTNEERW